jgi:hypothetical protein
VLSKIGRRERAFSRELLAMEVTGVNMRIYKHRFAILFSRGALVFGLCANCTDNGTSFTWTGIVVTGIETNGGYAPTTSTDSVTLWYGGGGTEDVAITNCTANCGTVTPGSANIDGDNAGYATLFGGNFAINSSLQTTLAPPPATPQCAEDGSQCNFYDYTLSTVCWGNACLVPGNGTIRDLTLVSLGSGDFAVQGNSIELTFALPETTTATPEPSSFVMLGTGLLSVLGAGWRRKFRASV